MGSEVRSLYVVLSANASAFKGQIVGAGQSVRGFGQDVTKATRENDALRQGLSKTALVAGGALVAGIGAGIYMNIQLEKQMRNVATISDEVADNLDFYSQKIIDMAAELPQTTSQLADGLYDIVSSGYDGAEALEILRISAMSASAGMTDTAVAAKATLTVLNAYGLGAESAADVSDILFQAVNKGVMTYEELAGAIGAVVPTAAAAGVEFDEVAAALATITLNGITADEASTSLNQTIAKILVPGTKLSGVLADMGYESGLAALEANGLKGTIDMLAKSQGRAADTAFALFPEIRAARGYMALTGNEGKNYARTFASIASEVERAEAAQRAYQTQSESDAASWDRIVGNVQSSLMGLADAVMPVVTGITDGIEMFTDMIGAVPAPVMQVVGVLALLAGAGLLVAGGFLKAQTQIAGFRLGLATLTGASRTATLALKGLQLSMGVLGVVLVAATAIYGAYTASKNEAVDATDDFVSALQAEQDGVKNAALSELVKKLVSDGSIDRLKELGITTEQAVSGIIGTEEQWKATQDALAEQMQTHIPAAVGEAEAGIASLEKQFAAGTISLEELRAGTMEYQQTLDVHRAEVAAVEEGYGELEGTLKGYRDDLHEANDIVALLTETDRKAAAASLQFASGLVQLENRFAPVIDGERQYSAATKALIDTLGGMSDPMSAFNAALKDGEVSLDRFIRKLQKQVTDMHNYVDNLALLAAQGRTALVNEFIAMGPEAAGLVAQAVNASDRELNRLERLFGASATYSTVAFAQGLNALPAIAADKGKLTVEALAKAFTGGQAKEAVAMLRVLRDSIQDIPLRHKIDLLLANYGDVESKAKNLAKRYNDLPKDVRTDIKTDGIPKTMADVLKLQKQYGLTDEEVLTILLARDNASVKIQGVQAKLRDLDGDEAVVTIRTVRKGGYGPQDPNSMGEPTTDNANGGLYVAGRRFADGGFGQNGRYYSRTPQIVPGGANVLWGEQETGWEAYVSGKASQRGRNVAILSEAARRFGYGLAPRGTQHVSGGGGRGSTVVIKQVLPDRMTLVVDGTPMTAYVRRHAAAVVNERDQVTDRAAGTYDRMSWGNGDG